jgi:hypothetical protein
MKNPVTWDMNQTTHSHIQEETNLYKKKKNYMDMEIWYIILSFFILWCIQPPSEWIMGFFPSGEVTRPDV